MIPYKNSQLSPQERARDLLSRMTLREKLAQMRLITQINRNFDGEAFDRVFPDGLGATYDTIALKAEEINRMQRHMIENTRLGIPIFMMSESLHGFFCDGATVFPQALGLGATFDPELIGEIASAIGREAHAMGIHETYAPNLDLSRDPRWGRVEENYGEDPYLTSRMGVAYIRGLQSHGIAASPKHYVAHGSPEAGINIAPVHAGERELRETMLKPFAAAFTEGGAMSVMPAYSELDGTPVHASRFLMTDILRGELGFEGWSVSDWGAVSMLIHLHRVASDALSAGKAALHAGIDMEAPNPFGFGAEFAAAAERGEVDIEEIDQAVYRILLGKFRLGLFEHPYAEENAASALNSDHARALALKAAEESCVLLKNDGVLPLKKEACRIALIGPGANLTQLGDYTAPSATDRAVTLYDAIKARIPNENLLYEKGCSIAFAEEEEMARAVQAAQEADVAILVISDNSSSYAGVGWGDENAQGASVPTCGESFDMHTLKFPGRQQELFERVAMTGTPLVLLAMTGRPYELTQADQAASAILQIWYPGQEGGEAVARLLFGESCPSGRTPISFPRSVGHIPCFYNHKPSAQGYYHKPGSYEQPGHDYVFDRPGALYPFGHGLSYTRFEYSNLTVEQTGEMAFEASVTVKNVGNRPGEDAVLLFLSDLYCRVTPFVRQLRGIRRVSLKPGESARVHFPIGFDDLSFINEAMKPEVEPGEFQAAVGELRVRFELQPV